MVDKINSVQITDLSFAPSLANDTEFMIQRKNQKRAEKSTLSSLSSWFSVSFEVTQAIATRVDNSILNHIQANDPHGDRSYSDSKINLHITSADPHGDRLYSVNYTNNELTKHLSKEDPHSIKPYVDLQVKSHTDSNDPHKSNEYADNKIEELKRNIDLEIGDAITQEFRDRVGNTITPLVQGKVPIEYVYKNIEKRSNKSFFPVVGDVDVTYIATETDESYYWDGSSYKSLKGVSSGSASLTTDDIPEGVLRGRYYLTTQLKNEYSSKVNSVKSGNMLSTTSTEKDVVIKNIEGSSSIRIEETPTKLIVRDSLSLFKTETINSETKTLTDIDNKLTSIDIGSKYSIIGTIDMESKSELNGVPYIKNFRRYNIETTYANNYSKRFIASAKFVGLGFSSDNTKLDATHIMDNATLSIYNSDYVLIEDDIIIPDGDVTTSVVDGAFVYVQAVFDSHNSFTTPLRTSYKGSIPEVFGVNYSTSRLKVYGQTGSNVFISLTKDGVDVEETTSDCFGNFVLNLTEPLIVGGNYSINYSGYSKEVDKALSVTLEPLSGISNVIFNKVSKTVEGKTEPEVEVKLYNHLNTEVGSYLSDLDGNFKGDVDYSLLGSNSVVYLKLKKESIEGSVVEFKIDVKTPTSSLPTPVEYESISFDKVYENLTNTSEKIELSYENNMIKIYVTGIDGLTMKWEANLKIIKESI